MDVLRRIIPRKMKRDQYSFELLKSTSAMELSRRDSSTTPLPRHFSQYDSIQTAPSSQTAISKKSEEVIDVSDGEMTEVSSLIGFVAGPREPSCSSRFAQEDPLHEKAINECHAIQEKSDFAEGVLLKCIDKKPLFPYLHFAQFRNPDHLHRMRQIAECVRECSPTQGSLYGSYDEVYSIQKTATAGECRLPAHRHAGYIVIGFKLLDDATKQQTLEKTWLSWSGAREIYKHSPRSWNLRRISLMKCPSNPRNGGASRPFAYILMCEYGSILHPSNTIQALDICERLRVRNCGHIALYQVHTAYSNPIPRQSTSNSPSRSSPFASQSTTSKRAQMMRGFSQDVDVQQQIEMSSMARRNRMLRTRERSFQYPDEYYHSSYHHSDMQEPL
ncbi:unnamed protein product [Caenorhabditis bovis]|uniref:DUF7153 domain-containing protein n=1 Tax=Caenorhabditis bovis TaxID=2654633 RepID=A0A8S1EEB0_9PELO|nr:unnamed protein product [Caenorhabditis bovis]